jgi:hypothetical protein
VRRNSWELSSLDPSTWPVFGITNDPWSRKRLDRGTAWIRDGYG